MERAKEEKVCRPRCNTRSDVGGPRGDPRAVGGVQAQIVQASAMPPLATHAGGEGEAGLVFFVILVRGDKQWPPPEKKPRVKKCMSREGWDGSNGQAEAGARGNSIGTVVAGS